MSPKNHQLRTNFRDDLSWWSSQFIWKFKPKIYSFWVLRENILQFKTQAIRDELPTYLSMLKVTDFQSPGRNSCTRKADLSYTQIFHCEWVGAPNPLRCSRINYIFFPISHLYWGCQPHIRGFRLSFPCYTGPINILQSLYNISHWALKSQTHSYHTNLYFPPVTCKVIIKMSSFAYLLVFISLLVFIPRSSSFFWDQLDLWINVCYILLFLRGRVLAFI